MVHEFIERLPMREVHNALRDIAVWAVCAAVGFLAWNSWQTSMAIRELTLEIRHLAEKNSDNGTDLKQLRTEFDAVRAEQLRRSENVYSSKAITGRMDAQRVTLTEIKQKIVVIQERMSQDDARETRDTRQLEEHETRLRNLEKMLQAAELMP